MANVKTTVRKSLKKVRRKPLRDDSRKKDENSSENSQSSSKSNKRVREQTYGGKRRTKPRIENNEDSLPELDSEEILKGLLTKTCQINIVSPIRVAEFNINFLNKLNKLVLLALEDNISVHLNCHWIYRVRFQVVPGIKSAEKDGESLYFSIFRKDSALTTEDSDDVDDDDMTGYARVFHGLFSSRGSTGCRLKYFSSSNIKKYQNLPVLLYSGISQIWKAIQESIKNAFSCFILPFDMSTPMLKNITGRWILINQLDNFVKSDDKMTLLISLPSQTNASISQELTFFLTQFEEFTTTCRRYDEVTPDQVRQLWKQLLEGLSSICRFDLHKFVINKITSKNLDISKGGTIRIKQPSLTVIEDILSLFTSYAENKNLYR